MKSNRITKKLSSCYSLLLCENLQRARISNNVSMPFFLPFVRNLFHEVETVKEGYPCHMLRWTSIFSITIKNYHLSTRMGELTKPCFNWVEIRQLRFKLPNFVPYLRYSSFMAYFRPLRKRNAPFLADGNWEKGVKRWDEGGKIKLKSFIFFSWDDKECSETYGLSSIYFHR
jgi:hypothetical protein